jgi:lambda family phage portal protein
VPLQYQILEGDYIDHYKNELVAGGGRIVQGVEVANNGPRRAYWMFGEHPGEMPVAKRSELVATPIPADQVLHLFEKERPGQQRGVAWMYAAMVKLRELETYEEAELIRKRLEACLAAIVVNPEAMGDPSTGDVKVTPGITDMAGNTVEAIEPGMFYYARGGSDIKFTNPSAVPGYADYKRAQLHSASAGCLVTYELMTGDLSHVNYSSIRAGLLEYRRLMGELQWLTIIPVLLEPQWRSFIDFAVAARALPQDTPYDVAWSPPQFEAVDPLKDNTADQIAVRSGFKSLPEALAERGFDAEETAEEQA